MPTFPPVPADKVEYCKRHWPNSETQVDFDGVTYLWQPNQKEVTPTSIPARPVN